MKTFFILVFLAIAGTLEAQIAVNTNVSASVMAQQVFGPNVAISNATVLSSFGSSGIFTNGNFSSLGIDAGTVLTTGNAHNIPNPDTVFSSQCNSLPNGNLLMQNIVDQTTYDACILEFDAVPLCHTLATTCVFGSEEYPEFESWVHDGFGIFITGPNPLGGNYSNVNIAVLPGTSTPIVTNNVNGSQNATYYTNNSGSSTIVYDGITVPMLMQAAVVPCATYHVMIVIIDGHDCRYDSGVFFQHQDNMCVPDFIVFQDTTICPGDAVTLFASGNADQYGWSPSTGLNATTGSTVIASPLKTMVYTVSGHIGCDMAHATFASVTVTVMPAPDVFITPSNPIVEIWDSIVLTAEGASSYVWLPGGETTQSIVVSPDETILYTAIGTGGNPDWPCNTKADALVKVISGIFVPNAFTPNGDGLNDIFIPESIITEDEIEWYEFSVFNRFGERIFLTYSINGGWSGRYQNAESEQGVYTWMIRIKLKGRYDKTVTGHVSLIK